MLSPSTLQKYALFGGLLEEQIRAILPFMNEEKFEAEDIIIEEGNPSDKIYFILEGHVAVVKKEVYLARFSKGEAFGEMEVLDNKPAAASIKATSPVTVMTISNKSLNEIYKNDIHTFSLIVMNLARDLCRRLRKMDEKYASSTPIFF